jgi:hypothetical protein
VIDLSFEELRDLRNSLEFDRHRVGQPGCPIRRRAEWMLQLMDAKIAQDTSPACTGHLVHGEYVLCPRCDR